MYRVGFDVGGTFTDFTVHDVVTGGVSHFKTPSTPDDPSEAIQTGLAAIIGNLGIEPSRFSFIGHGTTVATNMVIERNGVLTGMLTTAGFRDVLEIGRQTRPSLYDYSVTPPPPLVDRGLRIEVRQRIDADGRRLVPLDEDMVAEAAEAFAAAGVEAVAVCFLHSYLRHEDELRAADILRRRLGDIYISVSSEVLPEFREFERFSTTVINAFVGPKVNRYMDRLIRRLQDLGIYMPPQTIHSNGGLLPVDTVRSYPVRTCLSGPAAGVVGAAGLAMAAGVPDVVTFDVGGTSTDVSLIAGGKPAFTSSRKVADYAVRSPMIDVQVIGAGGGSIAWIDAGGALKVGPMSAGAVPGPVAYGLGGTEPTLTDANLVLHRLDAGGTLAGKVRVDEAAARAAIDEKIARPLGLTIEAAAEGIVRIAVANMTRAIRSVSTEKGHDLSRFALFPYGGAGPLLATAVARECGMGRIIVPVEPGTLCARGILMSDVSLDFIRSEIVDADVAGWEKTAAQFRTMEKEATAWFDAQDVPADRRRFERMVDARYQGQNHEVLVPASNGADLLDFEAFLTAFAEAHRREYGYVVAHRSIEIVNCRLKIIAAVDRPATIPPPASDVRAPRVKAIRQVHFGTRWLTTRIYDRAELVPGTVLEGPAIIDEMSSTTIVGAGDTAMVDPTGNLLIRLSGKNAA